MVDVRELDRQRPSFDGEPGTDVRRDLGLDHAPGPARDRHRRPRARAGDRPSGSRPRGRSMPRAAIAAGEPKPTFQPRCSAPPSSSSCRRASIRVVPRTMRGSMPAQSSNLSSGSGQGVPRGVQRAGAAPPPDQQHVLVGGVHVPVPVPARREDHVARLRRLHPGVGVDLAVARHHHQELVGVRGARAGRAERRAAARCGPPPGRFEPAVCSSMRYCTCMSTQPSSSRRFCSSGTSSIVVRYGGSGSAVTRSPPPSAGRRRRR